MPAGAHRDGDRQEDEEPDEDLDGQAEHVGGPQ